MESNRESPRKRPRVLPSVTTHNVTESSWRTKIDEIAPLCLTEVALFVTGVHGEERQELYAALERVRRLHEFTIPFVHATSDMPEEEFYYLMYTFGTQLFNLHPERQYPLHFPLSAWIRQFITIENAFLDQALEPGDLDGYSGVCLDAAHLEELRRSYPDHYQRMEVILEKFPVMANHLSESKEEGFVDDKGRVAVHSHIANSDTDFAYLRRFPAHYFGVYAAIELENSLSRQTALIPKIERILDDIFEVSVLKAA